MDAVWQEMKKVRVVIEEYEGDPNQLVSYTEITRHILFDFKYGENFRRDSGYLSRMVGYCLSPVPVQQ